MDCLSRAASGLTSGEGLAGWLSAVHDIISCRPIAEGLLLLCAYPAAPRPCSCATTAVRVAIEGFDRRVSQPMGTYRWLSNHGVPTTVLIEEQQPLTRQAPLPPSHTISRPFFLQGVE